MQILKTRAFHKWALKEDVSDQALEKAITEIGNGLVDADLGSHLYKKRIAVGNKGKSGGVRTLLAFRAGDRAIFIYGFAKNARANIAADEEKALKRYAMEVMGFDSRQMEQAVKAGVFIEVNKHGGNANG